MTGTRERNGDVDNGGATPDREISLIEPAVPPAVAALRHAASNFATAHGAGSELAADVGLAVSEAVTNTVKYAYRPGGRGQVQLDAAARDGWLEIRVNDRGRGFGAGQSEGLGLGLAIIARLCSDLTIVQEGQGTEVRMRFVLRAAA